MLLKFFSYYPAQAWYLYIPSEYGRKHAYECNHDNYAEERQHQRGHHEYSHALDIGLALSARQALDEVVRRYVDRSCQRLVAAYFRAVGPYGWVV